MKPLTCAVLVLVLPVQPLLARDPDAKSPRRERPEALFAPLDLPTPTEVRLGSGAPGPAYWQQRVDYRIDAVLHEDEQRLDADMTVTYHNDSPHTLTYIWIQLEQNLFRTDSLGTRSRSPGGVMREMEETFDGGYDIASITTDAGEPLHLTIYDTLARFDLPHPLAPGETFTFRMTYSFTMPPYLRRMGAEEVEQGTIFEYAQWFPHVCVYDDVSGWNTLPYLGTGEFYTNFGTFDVSITVPRDHIVSATGVLTNPEEVLTTEQQWRLLAASVSDDTIWIIEPERVGDPSTRPPGDGPLTWKFHADDVRTFAWASSPAFIWDACSAAVTDDDGTTRRVLCQSFYPREAAAWRPDAPDGGSSQYVKHAVEFYSEWLFPYPYPVMSNINGPEGGMEYPMIIFCGSRRGRGPFGVTDHEVGHTWFPMIVNTDERRHIWMDEGFNTFINGYSRRAFREKLAKMRGEEYDASAASTRARRAASRRATQPIATAPDAMRGRNVGALGYSKPGLAMTLLREQVLGPDRFDTAFREYIRRWAFKSPQPADFFRTMEDAAGADLDWFFRQWFYETGVLDLGIDDVEIDEERLSFVVVNFGEQVMPVDVEVAFDDETSTRMHIPVQAWFSTNRRSVRVPLDGRSVVRISIDPERVLPDADRDDNTWSPDTGQPAP